MLTARSDAPRLRVQWASDYRARRYVLRKSDGDGVGGTGGLAVLIACGVCPRDVPDIQRRQVLSAVKRVGEVLWCYCTVGSIIAPFHESAPCALDLPPPTHPSPPHKTHAAAPLGLRKADESPFLLGFNYL